MVTKRQADVGTLRLAAEILRHYDFASVATAVENAVEAMGGGRTEPPAIDRSRDARLSEIAEGAIERAIRRQWIGVTDRVVHAIVGEIRTEVAGSWVMPAQPMEASTIDDPTRTHLVEQVRRVLRRGPVMLTDETVRTYVAGVMAAIDGIYGEPPEGAELSDPQVEIDRLTRIIQAVRGMARAGEWIDGDSLGRYIDYRLLGVPQVKTERKDG